MTKNTAIDFEKNIFHWSTHPLYVTSEKNEQKGYSKFLDKFDIPNKYK